jgi:2-polyprenyl-6-methoxyphenol hydroxylase-like FAD-dependent oxidoreductase
MVEYDVVIVGAGPVGLMLACELSLCGVRPIVLERRPAPGDLPKANGLVGQVVRLLDYRGLLERFRAAAGFVGAVPSFPFGAVELQLSRLDGSPLHAVLIPQPRMEELLAEHAAELGVDVRRGREVVGLRQDAGGVTVDVRGPEDHRLRAMRARYVVGCDGGHSAVRASAGIDFPGMTDAGVLRLAHLRLADSVVVPGTMGALDVPGAGRLQAGVNHTSRGTLTVASLQPGVHIVAVHEKEPSQVDPDVPMTLEELQASVRRVIGVELPVEQAIWVSRTVGQSRQAERYRAGRVLLAGDAAHLFSAGGSALNVGLLDAVNLGWKLAAEVEGRASPGLLDTYHAERHPVGRRALMQTRAQAAIGAGDEGGAALRELFAELLQDEPPLRRIAEMLDGSDVRYDMRSPGDRSDPLTGAFAPDLSLTTADGVTRVAELVHRARPLRRTAEAWHDRVDIVAAHCEAPPARALLLRPDAHIAWTLPNASPPAEPLHHALARWFGPPHHPSTPPTP